MGGVGVIADGVYGADKDITATDASQDDEAIAFAASYSYAAPVDRRADPQVIEMRRDHDSTLTNAISGRRALPMSR